MYSHAVDCVWADWSSCIFESCGDGSKHKIVEGLRKREKRIPEQYGGKSCEALIANGKKYLTEQPCISKNCPGNNCTLPSYHSTNLVLLQFLSSITLDRIFRDYLQFMVAGATGMNIRLAQ